ncbi:MAG: c-type cytochrome biogenesis protein CcsB [Pontimonas sp.]
MLDFAYLSLVGVYSAMAVYTVAFLAFTWDLATRSAKKPVPVMAGGGREAEAPAAPATWGPFQRIGLTLSVLAWIVHLLATIGRGIAGNRVPWANMFEFGLTSTLLIVAVFLGTLFWKDLGYLGAYVTGFVLLALGVVTVNFYVDVVPLPPALQSGWLVIHVFVASTATAFFALGAALSVLQLVRARFEARQMAKARIMNTLPGSSVMESLAYRLNVVGFVLWSFTLIAGAIWAERAWGRYWGWDVKEVWTVIIWVLFAGYIHARATRGWRGSRAAWLGIIGFGAVLFNYTVVNIAFTGLHSYSGL